LASRPVSEAMSLPAGPSRSQRSASSLRSSRNAAIRRARSFDRRIDHAPQKTHAGIGRWADRDTRLGQGPGWRPPRRDKAAGRAGAQGARQTRTPGPGQGSPSGEASRQTQAQAEAQDSAERAR